MAHGGSAGQATRQVMNIWRQAIQTFYPDWDCRTYHVPPLHFNRVPYDIHHVAGLRVLVQMPFGGASSSGSSVQSSSSSHALSPSQSYSHCTSSSQPAPFALRSFFGEPARVQETDTRDDFALQHTMHCLQALCEVQHEPMFVISQLNFADYLNKQAHAQDVQQLPRPIDLTPRDRAGNFNVLAVHLKHGVLIGEIKAVGLTFVPTDAVVSKRVATAMQQLNKSERVFVHIIQDIAPGVRITKTLILPYITSQQLMRVLMADAHLKQVVCATLGAPDVMTAIQLCLCEDQLSEKAMPHDVTPQKMKELSGWFKRRMSGTVDLAMTRDVYINILARIVGPATTVAVHCITPPRVEVHTLGEAVSELGERLARVVLTPAQLSLVNRVPILPRVCLVGPPGTGKSLVLVLVGLHWLRAGHDVLVLSTCFASLAVSHVIRRQLEMTLREDPTPSAGTVRFLYCNPMLSKETDVEAAVQSVAAIGTLHILMDEVIFNAQLDTGVRQMVTKLFCRIPGLSLWCATVFCNEIPPSLSVEALTVPLRSAPVIVREVEQAVDMLPGKILGYTASAVPSTSDGPAIIRLRHEGGQHTGCWPLDCHQCGLEVAHVLRHQLHVGITGPVTCGSTVCSPPPLQYRDVFVLTRGLLFTDDVTYDEGNVVTPACGFVTSLRDAGIPVGVISVGDALISKDLLTEMAAVQKDQVTVINSTCTQGLERKVVVHLSSRIPLADDKFTDGEIEVQDKLLSISRCSSQLVMVDVPPAAGSSASNAAFSSDEAYSPLSYLMKQIIKILEKEFEITSCDRDTNDNDGEDSTPVASATAIASDFVPASLLQTQMAHGVKTGQATQQAAAAWPMNDWRQAIQTFYPNWEHQTYCVPPLYFNRVPYDTQHVAGLRVLVQQALGGAYSSMSSSHSASHSESVSPNQLLSSSQPSFSVRSFSGEPARVQVTDISDDFAQQHVMHCVQALGETCHESMFVISQLNYADYLNKPAYAQAAQQLPRPVDLPKHDRHGDFDILVVHLKHGILIGEIKTVGLRVIPTDGDVSKRVAGAVQQLNKSQRVVLHIMQDIAPGVRITKTLILPYITSQQLMKVLMGNAHLQQAVCATLDAPDVTSAVQLCLCADQLSDKATPYGITPQTMTQLSGWFTRRMSGTVDPTMTRDVYINILSRIVGPATTVAVHCVTPPRVEVRTLGEAVSELGERLARVVLTPAQLSLVTRVPSLPRVCLVGPPGTGKSLVLVLVGLHWLRAGHDVLVLSTCLASLAVSHVICRQLQMTLHEDQTPSAGTVRFLHYEVALGKKTDVEAAVQLVAATGTLHILMDEAHFSARSDHCLTEMVTRLFRCVPELSLWSATVVRTDIPPDLQMKELTVPLRSAPVIVREVRRPVSMLSSIHDYTASAFPSINDGPAIIRLRHEGGQHTGCWPLDCHECGREVAGVLRHQLRIGITGPVTRESTGASPPPLQYRDVFVLTRGILFSDVRDNEGNVVTKASGFVSSLCDEGIPVSVVSMRDVLHSKEMVSELASAQTDHVTVAHVEVAQGLERKVVVYLPYRMQYVGEELSDEEMERADKLYAVSRCIGQLVTVDVPPGAARELMHQALMIRQFMVAYNFLMAMFIQELMATYEKR